MGEKTSVSSTNCDKSQNTLVPVQDLLSVDDPETCSAAQENLPDPGPGIRASSVIASEPAPTTSRSESQNPIPQERPLENTRSGLLLLGVTFVGQGDQPVEQRRIAQPAGRPHLRVHADRGEARVRVDLVDKDATVV